MQVLKIEEYISIQGQIITKANNLRDTILSCEYPSQETKTKLIRDVERLAEMVDESIHFKKQVDLSHLTVENDKCEHSIVNYYNYLVTFKI